MKSKGPWLQKPLNATLATVDHSSDGSPKSYDSMGSSSTTPKERSLELKRHLTLFDLVMLGVGGTIGSGIFVLCGFIANNYAGPATCISWIISGIAACLSGVCYAELSCRMPSAGSSYVYTYASMGELPAVLTAACLSLEYSVSGGAVARSWGDKVGEWINMSKGEGDESHFYDGFIYTTGLFSPLATIVSVVSVLMLMNGVEESKAVANFFTITKVLLVAFMAIFGLILARPSENLVPFIPPQFGVAGILRGATSSFFGYVGFDEICCLAGESINPQRNIPLAIVITLGCVTFLYVVAALALTAMQPYDEISGVSGFPVAFDDRGYPVAAHLTAFGEVFTLPIVVLITLMAQPRLFYAMAVDGLVPKIFAKIDDTGNLWHGTVISGIFMIIVAAFVPFDHLDDMISTGILVAFSLTNSSLILLRCDSPEGKDGLMERYVAAFNALSFIFGFTIAHLGQSLWGKALAVISSFGLLWCVFKLYLDCPQSSSFGGRNRKFVLPDGVKESSYFKTPLLPFMPCMGIFVNWYLVTQLEIEGIGLLLGYLTIVAIFYYLYSSHHSVGNNGGWQKDGDDEELDDSSDALLNHNISLHNIPPIA